MKKARILLAIMLTSAMVTLQFSIPLADFNEDLISELVIGIPGESVYYSGGYVKSGAFDVMYGNLGLGLDDYDEQLLHQSISGVADNPEAYEQMGNALAIGDFNGDHHWDIAVGVKGEGVGGAVHIFHGNGGAVGVTTNYLITQDSTGVAGVPESGDNFGQTLAVGNFNNDAYDDLAVGVPQETEDATRSGIVHILFGSATGLTGVDSIKLKQGYFGLPDSEELDDQFGSALAVGDFDNNGYDDLAIGVFHESLEQPTYPFHVSEAGVVHVVYGDQLHPADNDDLLYEDSLTFGLCDTSDVAEHFGTSLATGDFDGDNFDDLVIGLNKFVSADYSGGIHIVYGSMAGLTSSGDVCWDGSNMGLETYPGTFLGRSLASCDFNGDGHVDLAVGNPFDTEGLVSIQMGSLAVVYGGDDGIVPSTAVQFKQGLNGLPDDMEDDDVFSWALAAGNFNGDAYCDLAVSAPGEDFRNPVIVNAGLVHVLYGSAGGITTAGNQLWYQGHNGLQGAPGANERFGEALASISFSFTAKLIFLPLIKK